MSRGIGYALGVIACGLRRKCVLVDLVRFCREGKVTVGMMLLCTLLTGGTSDDAAPPLVLVQMSHLVVGPP